MKSYNRTLKILNAHLDAAKAYAKLSYAKRLQVGAVLVKDDRIVSIGYNGMPSGLDNVCEIEIDDLNSGDWDKKILVTKPEVVHAEMNAIAYAARNGVVTEGCAMVTTHSPCFECAKMLMQAGIDVIYYGEEYRLTDSLKFLGANNIAVIQVPKI